MILNLIYDQPIGSLPVGFVTTINAVVSFFQSTFTDSVTVNIDVGYGEVHGQALSQPKLASTPNIAPDSLPLNAGALGASITYFSPYTYAQIRSALGTDAKSADDSHAVLSLPATDPTGGVGHYWVTTAEAEAMGLSATGNNPDGYVGFSNSYPFDYNNVDGVSPGTYDFYGVVAHEFSEVMGRQVLVGGTLGGQAPSYEPLDLFHFSAPNTRIFTQTTGYFSPDNGATDLDNFNTNPGGDAGDWAGSAAPDAALAFSNSGVVNPFTEADIRAMDVLGWDRSPADTTPPTLSGTSPADNSTNVAVGSNLVLTFSESVMAGSGNVIIHKFSDGSTIASIAITDNSQVSFSGSTITINPSSDLAPGTQYYVTIASGVIQDLAGNAFAGILSNTGFDFTTVPPTIATRVASDFNGDGYSDIIWQNDNGQAQIWLMNGATVLANSTVGPNPGPSWHVKGAGDFDGNGKADILWQNDNGQAVVWFMNGTSLVSYALVGQNPGPTWHIKGAGDFNGDGKSDILWQNDDGRSAVWLLNGSDLAGGTILTGDSNDPAWRVKAAGDFNGDGKADIMRQNATTGQAEVWLMDGTNVLSTVHVGNNSDTTLHVKGIGDFNGDGKADILWQGDDGHVELWLMNGTSVLSDTNIGNPGTAWHVKGVEDFNGDGKADIVLQNDDGHAAVWLMNGATLLENDTLATNLGPSWHVDWA